MSWQAPLTPFSDRLSPVFVRDLRQLLRSPIVVISFLILQVVVLGFTGLEILLLELFESVSTSSIFSGGFEAVLSIAFSFVLPLTAIGALQPELGPGRNIEILLSSSLSRWQIVLGKWLTMTILSAILLCSVAPFFLARYFLGSVDLLSAGALIASTLLSNAVINAIVVGASGFSSYLARGLVIFLFSILFITTASISLASFGSKGPSWLAIVLFPLVGFVFTILALQIGRAQLKLFTTLLDPPATGGIFVMAFVFPFVVGIALATGGTVAMTIVSVLWLGVSFLIDRSGVKPYKYAPTVSQT